MKRSAALARDGVRDDLGVYHSKRDFTVTGEPKGKVQARGSKLTYVIQRHDARRLHFDFRIELDGVLKSWAVPKGPSLSPSEKRLAVQVEDHPYDYGGFEGAIPKGEYGGGHVLIWDRGEWKPIGDPHDGLRKGHLKFTLCGDRLQGGFALIRMRGRGGDKVADGGKANWLLIKEQDRFAKKGAAAEITTPSHPPAIKKIELQLATLESKIPLRADWIYEMKLDGYRAITVLEDGKARVHSRSGLDWTKRFPAICKAIESLPIPNAIFDGEICAVDDAGRTRFQELQNALSLKDDSALRYFVFDLLFVDGMDIRDRPLLVRKAILQSVLEGTETPLTYVTHLDSEESITAVFADVCKQGLEGIIAKRRDRPYVGGRGGDWVKVKCVRRQEMVIVGFTAPRGSRRGLGALLLGVQDKGALRYAGKVGTGFSQASLSDLSKKLGKLRSAHHRVTGAPRLKDATWVEPSLVCEVSFTEWTRDGALRHPSFLGLREDKSASEVVRERPKAASTKTAKNKLISHSPNVVEGVAISHPERVVDATTKTTKLDLAEYYAAVSELLLPYADHRPIALVRCPEGTQHECFFQKRAWAGAPTCIHRGKAEGQEVLSIRDTKGLLSLVQFGAVEFHGWGSRFPRPSKPDWIVMDLDPDEGLAFSKVVDAANELRESFATLDLESFVKTTGGKGLHVVVPIKPRFDFDALKKLTHSIAQAFETRAPKRFVSSMAKKQRAGKIFIDYLRNGSGSTAILPYSTRTKNGLGVAMPVAWQDLARIDPRDFDVRTAPAYLAKRKEDPWARFFDIEQSLPDALEKLTS